MKLEELRPGTWVKFAKPLSERGVSWAVGDVAMVKDVNLRDLINCITLVAASSPKKTGCHGDGLPKWFEANPIPNPFESGPGIGYVPPIDREPWVPSVGEYDLLPEP